MLWLMAIVDFILHDGLI